MPKDPKSVTAAQYRQMMANGASGSAWRGKVAKPGEVDGIRFPSKIQTEVYRLLSLPRRFVGESDYGNVLIVREPIFDLLEVRLPGGKPSRYRPDFLVINALIEPRVIGIEGKEHSGFSTFDIEIHEAKGSRSSESRDWVLRAKAAAKAYPWLPMYVWRWSGKKPRRYTLEEALS